MGEQSNVLSIYQINPEVYVKQSIDQIVCRSEIQY